jgi:hypothetical protein
MQPVVVERHAVIRHLVLVEVLVAVELSEVVHRVKHNLVQLMVVREHNFAELTINGGLVKKMILVVINLALQVPLALKLVRVRDTHVFCRVKIVER